MQTTGVEMRLMLTLSLTAAFGALGLWVGIPTGLALGLPPLMSGAAATAGGLLGATLVTLAGEQLQRWVYSRRWLAKRRQRVERLWNRYGLIRCSVPIPRTGGNAAKHACSPRPRGPGKEVAVLDSSEFDVLGSGTHRGRRSWLLHIRELGRFPEDPFLKLFEKA